MATKWIEARAGSLGQKRRYRASLARIEALAEPYRTAAKALNRYFLHHARHTDGDTLVMLISEHADLWERAAVDGTPVHAIVGDDPVELAESFARAYTGKPWIDKERARLTKTLHEAEREEYRASGHEVQLGSSDL